jgi:hypothetical protein
MLTNIIVWSLGVFGFSKNLRCPPKSHQTPKIQNFKQTDSAILKIPLRLSKVILALSNNKNGAFMPNCHFWDCQSRFGTLVDKPYITH